MSVIKSVKPTKYGLAVIGGGMAGVCAAIAAARHGCRTALIQDRPMLGGNSSSEIRMHICGADNIQDGLSRRETGILEEMRLADLTRNPQHSTSMWDTILYEWAKREPLLDLYLNTLALEPIMASPERIEAVRARQLASEKELLIEADLFADCSGDGQIGAQAGADFFMGRESAEQYNENLAEEEEDRFTLGSSLLFQARDMGRPVPFIKPEWAYDFPSDEALQHRGHGSFRFGYWWIEWGGLWNTINDNEEIRDELLKILYGVWDHIKNHGDHGAENWALEWVGMVPGKRESRRFLGDYVLRQADLESGRVFDDAVAYGGWPIDVHPIKGIRCSDKPCTAIRVPIYTIPLRSLYSRNIENLFFAGRNASASHIAFASTRVMSTCAVMGQAVGTAAAICADNNLTPRQAAAERIGEVQELLMADDAYIPGHASDERGNLALEAELSSGPGQGIEKLLDGTARPVGDDCHCWESALPAGDNAWIEFVWKEPVEVNRVQLTFDSQLDRRLFLTQETQLYESEALRLITEIPATLVKSFAIEVPDGDSWQTVRQVDNNIFRLRREDFEKPLTTRRLRVRFTSTYGHESVRVFEARVE